MHAVSLKQLLVLLDPWPEVQGPDFLLAFDDEFQVHRQLAADSHECLGRLVEGQYAQLLSVAPRP